MSTSLRKPWRPAEDEMLSWLAVAHQFNWSQVAASLSATGTTRTTKQCRERWTNHLDPQLNQAKWTEAERQLLFKCHQAYGNQWKLLSSLIPGRSDNAIKNFFNTEIKKAVKQYNKTARGNARILRKIKALVSDREITVKLGLGSAETNFPHLHPLQSRVEALFVDPNTLFFEGFWNSQVAGFLLPDHEGGH